MTTKQNLAFLALKTAVEKRERLLKKWAKFIPKSFKEVDDFEMKVFKMELFVTQKATKFIKANERA